MHNDSVVSRNDVSKTNLRMQKKKKKKKKKKQQH